LTGNKDIKIGKTTDPEISDISTYQFINDGSEVTIVDTPSFYDGRPHISDSKLLEDTTKFFLKRYAPRSREPIVSFICLIQKAQQELLARSYLPSPHLRRPVWRYCNAPAYVFLPLWAWRYEERRYPHHTMG